MESSFSKLEMELEELGYIHTLKPECVPLVSKLLSDLRTTTDNLQKYMKISKQAVEELDSLELGAEPYKCDNAKLIKECNELHFAFIQFKEKHEKTQKDLNIKINSLENQLKECNLQKRDLTEQIKRFQIERQKGGKLQTKQTLDRKGSEKSRSLDVDSVMACAEQKIVGLNKEIRKLRDTQLEIIKNNEFMKAQLENRNEEIIRLNGLLEGGRPLKAISKDCCYKNIDNKLGAYQEEINSLKSDRTSLQNQLKEAVSKQHEAMRRALHLAERNKHLEKEMRDIDQIALQVEAECNDTVKNNAIKVTRLQDRMNETIISIQNLERENSKLKQEKMELSSDLDAIRLEKKHLQAALESEIDNKKTLNDRINNFTVIEHDLNMEVDRLVRLTGEQKLKIAELECQIVTGKPIGPYVYAIPAVQSDSIRPSICDKEKSRKISMKKVEHKKTCKKSSKQSAEKKAISTEVVMAKCCCEAGECMQQILEMLNKEREFRETQANQQIESLKQEKEYFMKEYQKLSEQMRNIPSHENSERLHRKYDELLRKIEEKNQFILDLQNEIKTLNKDKFTSSTKVESRSDFPDSNADSICNKTTCRRKYRELEIHREEANHLQKENLALRAKIQELNQSTVFDQDRMKKAFQEMEEHIRKLEDERRELVVGQCTSRSNMTQLEEQHNLLKEQLRLTQNELNNVRANYNQLKNLHSETDRALSEAQRQLMNTETELETIHSKINTTSRESAGQEREIIKLQGDIEVLKKQLTKIDKEKDELLNVVDEKTEKIDHLEEQLKEKKGLITGLEIELKDLTRKLGKISDESSGHEINLRSSKQENAILQKDYDSEKKMKEAALQENRRLKDDMASVTSDCREARKELELSRRQVEDLTRQLQQYVAEVKRTEDMISQKELERTEILDQFKCLSKEANILECNNHTLENEATQSRVQLSVALDHASDLERKLANQEAIISSYERQIADLTSQVASMEIQMKQGGCHYERLEQELQHTKDLCLKLDRDKDNLKRDIQSKDDQKDMIERTINKLSKENDDLRKELDKDKNSLDGLEKLLNDARQEVIEQRLLNQELQSEVDKMKVKLKELQEKFITTSEQLDLYQEKALEYSQQNKQLRRDIANERFFRAKEDDVKRYPSL